MTKLLRTRGRVHSGGLISLSGQDFSKLMNFHLITLSAAISIPDREITIKG